MQLFPSFLPAGRPLEQRHPQSEGPDPGLAPRGTPSHAALDGCNLPIGDIVLPQLAMSSARASGDFWRWVTPCPSPSWGPPPGGGEGH